MVFPYHFAKINWRSFIKAYGFDKEVFGRRRAEEGKSLRKKKMLKFEGGWAISGVFLGFVSKILFYLLIEEGLNGVISLFHPKRRLDKSINRGSKLLLL